MLEAQQRGHALWHYEVRHMALREGVQRQGDRREERLFARARPVTVRAPARRALRIRRRWRSSTSRTMDVVLMRQDPPFDMAYITATHLLEHIHPQTLVVNDPAVGAQRAGEAAGHAFPRPDAADDDHLGPGGDPRLPPRIPGHHRQAAVRQWRRRRVPHQAGRREPRRAAGNALRPLARAADVPALRARGAPGRQAHHPGRWRADGRGQPRAGAGRGALQHACRRPAGEMRADRARPRDLRRASARRCARRA